MLTLEETIAQIIPTDRDSREQARKRLDALTMPHWALGRLMDLSLDLAAITRSMSPEISRRTVVVMAGDHGVVAEGVSKYPKEVTAQMVGNFVAGGAGINALAGTAGAEVCVVDMGVACDLTNYCRDGGVWDFKIAPGTSNMAHQPAMSRELAIASLEAGIDVARALAVSTDLYGTGEMGIGNTTPSAAVVATLTGCSVAEATGRGTGIDEEQLKHKIHVIEKSLALHDPNPADAIDVLSKVGGFELGGLAGLILGAAALKKPVIIDGFISTAAALISQGIAPTSAEYMIAAHQSVEPGHRHALDHLKLQPLLDLGFRLGEGTGAAMGMCMVDGAKRILTEVATFEEAAVSQAAR